LKKILILIFILLFSNSVFSDTSDYIVGLNAYNDGFYDIAKISLEDYLKKAKEKSNVIYSKYLLYQIYLSENNLKKAETLFNDILKIKDKRFDYSIIRRDRVRFLIKNNNCEKAKKIVEQYPENLSALIFVNSKCRFGKNTYKAYLNKKINHQNKLKAIFKSNKNPKAVAALFNQINLKKLTNQEKKYLGAYFYKYKDFKNFWKVYNSYKDDDMVNFALNRLWDIKDEKAFLRSFKYNNKYKISPVNNCRALQIYTKKGENFACKLIDNCYKNKSKNYYKSMLACLIKKNNSEDIKNFLFSIKEQDFKYVCEYSEYLIANNFYDLQWIHRFSKCKQVDNIADILLDKKRPNDILKLFSGKSSDKAYFYISKAYEQKNNKEKAKLYKNKIKNKKLKSLL
jgi:hypothetical protein